MLLRRLANSLRDKLVASVDVPSLLALQHFDAIYELRLLQFARQRLAPGTVGFVGSSSIRLWRSLRRDFKPVPVVNRGLGASQVEHCVRYAPRLVSKGMAAIVIYGGDNDLAAGKSVDEIVGGWKAFLSQAEAIVPSAPVVMMSVKCSPAREALLPQMEALNAAVKRLCQERSRTYFIDVSGPMLSPDGRPRTSFYHWDGLHLSERGYTLWTSLVWPVLEDALAGRPPHFD